jgi:UDP-N-acetylmuramoyl-tripeptide--D-alanyl-D-alanine ligase
MEAAIDVLNNTGSSARKVAVLGDMLEMGNWACKVHSDVGRYAVARGIEYIIATGEHAADIAMGALEEGMSRENIHMFKNVEEVNIFLESFIRAGDVVLVKGSRKMEMEKAADFLEHRNLKFS